MNRLNEDYIAEVFRQALNKKEILSEEDTALIFFDLSHIRDRLSELTNLFPSNTLHAIAVKANPLVKILEKVAKAGAGFEAASLPEVHLAMQTGVDSKRIVFDSPVRTKNEIRLALELSCHINADSLLEVDRISELIAEKGNSPLGTIGLRINPQIGQGTISSTSVAGNYSKFGAPIEENRDCLIDTYKKHDWLTGVHVHIGSQGCSIDMLLDGMEIILNFVTQVNNEIEQSGTGTKITTIDIGGGLPVSYHRDREPASLSQYVQALRNNFGEIFTEEYKLITEFGRYIHANAGWVASRVEYVKSEPSLNTAMIHVGADLFLRKCYRPEDWHHEVFVLDKNGNRKLGNDKNPYVIAGPLCFAGDVIAENISLPCVEEGDYIIVQDTGAYTLSMWSRYNSRQIPKVVGYDRETKQFEPIRARESTEDLIEFWS